MQVQFNLQMLIASVAYSSDAIHVHDIFISMSHFTARQLKQIALWEVQHALAANLANSR